MGAEQGIKLAGAVLSSLCCLSIEMWVCGLPIEYVRLPRPIIHTTVLSSPQEFWKQLGTLGFLGITAPGVNQSCLHSVEGGGADSLQYY